MFGVKDTAVEAWVAGWDLLLDPFMGEFGDGHSRAAAVVGTTTTITVGIDIDRISRECEKQGWDRWIGGRFSLE